MKSNTPKTCFTYGFAALLLCVTGLPATVGADSAIKEKPVARSGRSNAVPLPAPREVAGTYAKALEDARALRPIDHQADSAIIFIGDGMGMSTVTAARILAGQREGRSGEEGMLAWEHLPSSAFVKTFNTNQQVADSAGTATAIFTGHRTNSGVLGIGPSVSRGDCEGSKRAPLASLFELATGAGLATGVVTDTRITHATPAAAYAHTPERDWESNLEMPEAAREAGCKDIATQLVDANIDVVFGGGLRAFLPQTDFRQLASGGGSGVGERTDGRNLVQAWLAQSPDRRFITDKDALDKLDPSVDGAVLGLFAPSHLAYRYKRANTDQPSLTDMTTRAIELLQSKSKRWLLLVEAGRIDHGHHEGRAAVALDETIALSETVAAALSLIDLQRTTVIVTADHSHTLTISGYPTRGNPILGKVVANGDDGRGLSTASHATDGKPYTTLGYANGPGSVDDGRKRVDLTDVNTATFQFQQDARFRVATEVKPGVELIMETHSGEDVPLWAAGPRAYLFGGTIEQPFIFHALAAALELPTAVATASSRR